MRPLIIAHRGASNLAPENTLASFRLAKELGADGIECDVQLTKDHKLVIAHDFFTDAHTGVKGDIYDMTFDELRQLDFGKWKSPEYEGEKIPTIEEVLDIGKDMKMMHIELKPYLDRDADFPERVIDAVVNAHMEDKVILTSFQYGLLGRIKEIRPEIRTAALFLNTESSLCPVGRSGPDQRRPAAGRALRPAGAGKGRLHRGEPGLGGRGERPAGALPQ